MPGPSKTLPNRAGAGFKVLHAKAILEGSPKAAWFEVHPENYIAEGGPRLALLDQLSARFPVSFHGLALSLAGFERPDREHLKSLRTLIRRIKPASFSEHLAWSAQGGAYFGDLLPVPLTREALKIFCRNLAEAQEVLERRILIENPALYLDLPGEMAVGEFLMEAAAKTGSGLLLDINNLYVSAKNTGADPDSFLETIDFDLVGEVHLAGYSAEKFQGKEILIDSHGAAVSGEVWGLFRKIIKKTGPKPVLVEWDNAIPDWQTLEAEVKKADTILTGNRAEAA